PRGPRGGVLLVKDELLDQRGAASAVLARPAQPGPAAFRQRPLPPAPLLHQRMLVAGAAAPAQGRKRAAKMRFQPGANLTPEGFLRLSKAQIHPVLPPGSRCVRRAARGAMPDRRAASRRAARV